MIDSTKRPLPLALIEASIGLAGSTMSLCTLVKRLDKSEYAPHVIVARAEQEAYLRDRLGPNIPIHRVSPAAGAKAARWARGVFARPAALLDLGMVTLPYSLALARYFRRHDIRLVHHNNGFELATVSVCRVLGIPLVAYQRGNEWHSWTVRRLAPLASQYVSNSEATRDDLRKLGIPDTRITVVYPPVDLKDFDVAQSSQTPRSTRRAYGVPADAVCFGIVGQLQDWKGQRVFLQAAARVLRARSDAWAWVIGGPPAGGEAYADELKRLVHELGIADRVVFTGFVSDVPGHLALLDIVVHASIYPEPFGRVIVEAMLAGRPVIAADAGGPREIIEPERTGLLVAPRDDAALSNAILKLISDPAFGRKLAAAAMTEAGRRFSPTQHARYIEAVYRRALSADDGGARERTSQLSTPSGKGDER